MTRVVSRSDFVAGIAGPLFRMRSWPVATRDAADDTAGPLTDSLPTVFLVAPIGEEMNRARRFLAMLRRECARCGAQAVLVDPFGTGDSAGEFVEATWEVWVDDLVAQAEALVAAADGKALTLLGLRSGCLLVDTLARRLDSPPTHVVEVQPEHDGAAVVRRLLSTRALAERFAGRKGGGVAELEARISAGESLELGGYEINAALLQALGAARIEPGAAPCSTGSSCRFDLTESISSSSGGPSKPSAPTSSAGKDVSATPDPSTGSDESGGGWQHQRLPTRPFWQLAESVPDPQVVARIVERLVP